MPIQRTRSKTDENEINGSLVLSWKCGLCCTSRGGRRGCWRRSGLWLLCCPASAPSGRGCLYSTLAWCWIFLGWRLLVPERGTLCVARGLLGPTAVLQRALGGPALLRPSLLRRLLAALTQIGR